MTIEIREASRSLWRRDLAALGLWDLLSPLRIVPQAYGEEDDKYDFMGALHRMVSDGYWDLEHLLREADQYLDLVGPPESEKISLVLRSTVDALRSGENPPEYAFGDLHALSTQIRERLSEIEPGLAKAKGFLLALLDTSRVDADASSCETMCFLQDEVSDTLVAAVVRDWKVAIQAGKERGNFSPDIFWNSRDHEEEVDAVSYYRFLEIFDIGEFPGTIAEIEEEFREALMVPATWVIAARLLWLVSRSKRLLARMRPFAERSLIYVCQQQSAEGWWPRLRQDPRDELRPSLWTTALACVAIFRISRDDAQLERAREGTRWLAQQQQESGAWKHAPADDAYAQREELHTTLLACEAIKNLDADRYRSSLANAEEWIRSKQTSSGIWEAEPPLSPASMTVQVIEYLEGKRPPFRNLGDYLAIARDFILRAQEVAFENNPNAWRLSIVIAFQGMEAFLYACLEHPTINVPIFEGNSRNRTIGLRKALSKIEESLQFNGQLSEDESVPRRNQIDRLAYLRDEVVHKGAAVSREDARRLIEEADRFMDQVSGWVFGYSIS